MLPALIVTACDLSILQRPQALSSLTSSEARAGTHASCAGSSRTVVVLAKCWLCGERQLETLSQGSPLPVLLSLLPGCGVLRLPLSGCPVAVDTKSVLGL